MKRIILATMLCVGGTSYADSSFDLYVYGLSKHLVECKSKCGGGGFNEVNTGIAVGTTLDKGTHSFSWRVGAYKDSYGEQTKHVLVGTTYSLNSSLYFGVSGGWIRGSDFDTYSRGWGVFPVFGLRYKLVAFEMIPYPEVVATYLKISW